MVYVHYKKYIYTGNNINACNTTHPPYHSNTLSIIYTCI